MSAYPSVASMRRKHIDTKEVYQSQDPQALTLESKDQFQGVADDQNEPSVRSKNKSQVSSMSKNSV